VLGALARYMIPLVHQHAGYGAGHHPVARLLAEPLGLRAKHLANAGAIHIDVQVNMPVTINDVPDVYSGMIFDVRSVTGNAIELADRNAHLNTIFDNDRFIGGTQILDGIHWRNTDFVGTHIVYEGGEIELNNVHFINCTFEVPSNIAPRPKARQFLDYAALAQPELNISGE